MPAMPLGELYRLSGPLTKIIQLGPSFFTASNRLYVYNVGRVKGEYSLYSFIVHDSSDCKGLVNAAAFAGDYCAGKYLNAFFIAFPDFTADINHIAYFEMGRIFFQTFTFNSID